MIYTVRAWYKNKLGQWVDDFQVDAMNNEEAFAMTRNIVENKGGTITIGMEIKCKAGPPNRD